MGAVIHGNGLAWAVALLTMAGVIARPWRTPEALWAVLGGAAVVALGLLSWRGALAAIEKGTDVYLFLVGMMLLAELARREGLFDHLAARAARLARGSGTRLFALVYAIGILVTVLLSNDATAVVLTPAVYAAARAARAEPLPYLLICAFIANAASFVLPISNPANLIVFGRGMPPLGEWFGRFALAALLAIAATYVVLLLTQRRALRRPIAAAVAVPILSGTGQIAAGAIAATAIALLAASAAGLRLGLPTFLAGAAATFVVLLTKREAPWPVLRGVSWAVLPLVAGLFVVVESLDRAGLIGALGNLLGHAARHSTGVAALGAGIVVALACSLMNNLPAGLVAGSAIAGGALPAAVGSALLVGVDLGPNLSVTGSLATILWLIALRREGVEITAWRFLRLGAVVMPPALLLALLGLLVAAGAWPR